MQHAAGGLPQFVQQQDRYTDEGVPIAAKCQRVRFIGIDVVKVKGIVVARQRSA